MSTIAFPDWLRYGLKANSYIIHKDTGGFFAEPSRERGLQLIQRPTLSDILNTAIANVDAIGGGSVLVKNMGTISIAQWGTTKVNVKQTTSVFFERGGVFNINITGDVFLAADANGRNKLILDANFQIYGAVTNFVHLTNSIGSEVYIFAIQSGTGALLAGSKAVYIDGNPAYYNIITILLADFIDTVVHFPFVTVGANANTIPYLNCQHVNYAVKIDQNVSDNYLQRIVIDAGGVATGSTHGGVYVDGFSNVIAQLYGEYSSGSFGGPLLYLDIHAFNNTCIAVVQEGSGNYVSNNSTLLNLVDTNSGSPLSHRVGLDNRTGLTAADGAPITLITLGSATGQLLRITADIFATAYTSGTATYTVTWTENAVARTMVVTATVVNTLGTASDLINPDASTTVTAQLTGVFVATVKVAAVVEQLA